MGADEKTQSRFHDDAAAMPEKTGEAGGAEGRLITIYEFVRDGIITAEECAKRADQTAEEFKAGSGFAKVFN